MAKFKGSIIKCIQCERDFRVPPTRSQSAKYCNPKCKYEYWVGKHLKGGSLKKNCEFCEKEFDTFKSQDNSYCSYECAGKAKSKHEERICAYCGESFEIKRTATNICCSWKCRIARQRTPDWPTRTKELKECQQCGKEFWVRQNRLKIGEGKFCSKKCLSKSQQIFNATAPEFYNMAEWREIRIKVLERDDNRCKTCGFNGKGLHVHHIEYKRNGGNEDMNNLITMCNQCHMRIHGQNKNKGGDII